MCQFLTADHFHHFENFQLFANFSFYILCICLSNFCIFFWLLVLVWSCLAWNNFLYFWSSLPRYQSQNSSTSCVTTNFLSAFCPTTSTSTTTTTDILMEANISNNRDNFLSFWKRHDVNTASMLLSRFYLIVQLRSLQGSLSSLPDIHGCHESR